MKKIDQNTSIDAVKQLIAELKESKGETVEICGDCGDEVLKILFAGLPAFNNIEFKIEIDINRIKLHLLLLNENCTIKPDRLMTEPEELKEFAASIPGKRGSAGMAGVLSQTISERQAKPAQHSSSSSSIMQTLDVEMTGHAGKRKRESDTEIDAVDPRYRKEKRLLLEMLKKDQDNARASLREMLDARKETLSSEEYQGYLKSLLWNQYRAKAQNKTIVALGIEKGMPLFVEDLLAEVTDGDFFMALFDKIFRGILGVTPKGAKCLKKIPMSVETFEELHQLYNSNVGDDYEHYSKCLDVCLAGSRGSNMNTEVGAVKSKSRKPYKLATKLDDSSSDHKLSESNALFFPVIPALAAEADKARKNVWLKENASYLTICEDINEAYALVNRIRAQHSTATANCAPLEAGLSSGYLVTSSIPVKLKESVSDMQQSLLKR